MRLEHEARDEPRGPQLEEERGRGEALLALGGEGLAMGPVPGLQLALAPPEGEASQGGGEGTLALLGSPGGSAVGTPHSAVGTPHSLLALGAAEETEVIMMDARGRRAYSISMQEGILGSSSIRIMRWHGVGGMQQEGVRLQRVGQGGPHECISLALSLALSLVLSLALSPTLGGAQRRGLGAGKCPQCHWVGACFRQEP